MRRELALAGLTALALGAWSRDASARSSCTESNRVVGFRRCAGTDRWRGERNFPAISLRPTLTVGAVQLAPMSFTDLSHRTFAGSSLGSAWVAGVGPTLEIGGVGFRHLYLGANGGMMAFRLPNPQQLALPDYTNVQFVNATQIHVGAVVGAAFGFGPVALRASVLVGWQQLEVWGALQQGELQGAASATRAELLLRPRLSVDWYFLPEGSLQFDCGADIALRGSFYTSIALVLHLQNYESLNNRH